MNIHEYQAKKLFVEYGIPTSSGKLAYNTKEALAHAAQLGGNSWVVKAQVHAGGRGKAGGVKMTHGAKELETAVNNMIGARLITKQSAPHGQPVNCILIQPALAIAAEFYLGIVINRERCKIAVMASSAGGTDIEKIAAEQPNQIHYTVIDPIMGMQEHQSRQIGFALNLNKKQRGQLTNILMNLYRLFIEKDLALIEINPLILTKAGDLQALDAKISIDDNALYRQPDLEKWRDDTQEDEKESTAKQAGLNYVTLDGNIGCMVNGAGLAMATMDVIKLHGGDPANFLDVGGGATTEKVAEAFKLITADNKVKAILVNIFGGIVRCDLIAQGIIDAVKEIGVAIPVIARLEGTNVTQGKKLLESSGLTLKSANDLSDAASKAVAAAQKESEWQS